MTPVKYDDSSHTESPSTHSGSPEIGPPVEPTSRIPWKRRADLICTDRIIQGRRVFVVKDPIRLTYFEIPEESWFLLEQLDGKTTLGPLRDAFQSRFPDQPVSFELLQQAIDQFIRQRLTTYMEIGHGQQMAMRMRKESARRLRSQWANPLAIRFRGVDPDQWMEKLNGWCGWVFSPVGLILGTLLMLSALMMVLVHSNALIDRLPEARQLISGENLIWLPFLLAGVKILHELGHGLVCKRMGGECREIGVLLLLLTPTLYCNVSDAWMLKSRWQRIAVSAAGMWVELLIAASATVLWWSSQPGLLHTLCLNLILLCGINTLILNGNPLLKYDGYFILTDWLEIPNLQERATRHVRSSLASWFCGVPSNFSGSLAWQAGLWAYGLASTSYRLLLTVTMLWGLYFWGKPHGLGSGVLLLSLPLMVTMVSGTAWPLIRGVHDPARRNRIRWPQFWMRSGLVLGLLIALLSIPLPMSILASASLDDGQARTVYVTVSGTLVDHAALGTFVQAGQVICRLEDPVLQRQLVKLDGDIHTVRVRLENLDRLRVADPDAAAGIPTLQSTLADLQAQRQQLNLLMDRLLLRAPCDGTVLPIQRRIELPQSMSLATWSGSPLNEENQGSYLIEGTPVCLIGDWPSHWADLLIPYSEATLVRPGQSVRVLWNESIGGDSTEEISVGRIVELGSMDWSLEQSAERASRHWMTGEDSPRYDRGAGNWLKARIELEQVPSHLPRGSTGRARIDVQPMSMASRVYRWIRLTFVIKGTLAAPPG